MGWLDRLRTHLDPPAAAVAADPPSRIDLMAEVGVTGLNRQGGAVQARCRNRAKSDDAFLKIWGSRPESKRRRLERAA